MLKRICDQRRVSLRGLAGNKGMEVRFGRFLSNESVRSEEIIACAVEKTSELSAGEHVLAIQDTTEINHQRHKNSVRGLGKVGNGTDIGFFLHPALVVHAGSGACFGLGAVHYWNRTKEKAENYQELPIEEKESFRWLLTAEAVKRNLEEAKLITIVGDRESDIYEEWSRVPDERTHLLTRACRDRKLGNGKRLFEYSEELPVAGTYTIEVQERIGKRSKHRARLEVRFGEVVLKRPQNCSDKNAPKEVRVSLVDVREVHETVISGEEAIHWRLLTTHEVNTLEQARDIIAWYCERWNIEQLFRTLKKQGLDVESSQITTAEALIKLTLIALRAAIQTLQLTLARDGILERPAQDAFSKEEVQLLGNLLPTLEGKTQKQKNPHSKATLAWAAWIIARLGGWKGYASERPPGPITMIRGQKELASIARGWRLARDV